jgi:hypothetical protein
MGERGISGRALENATQETHRINRNKIAALLEDSASPTLAEVLALATALGIPSAALLPAEITADPPWQEVSDALDLSMHDAIALRESARMAVGRQEVTADELLGIWWRSRGLRPGESPDE